MLTFVNAVNIMYAGHLLMGDTTYNHIYHDTGSTGTVTQNLRQPITAKSAPEDTLGPHQDQPLPTDSHGQQHLPTQATDGVDRGYSPEDQPLPRQSQVQQHSSNKASQGQGRTPSPAETAMPVRAIAGDAAGGMHAVHHAAVHEVQSPGPAPAADTPTGEYH